VGSGVSGCGFLGCSFDFGTIGFLAGAFTASMADGLMAVERRPARPRSSGPVVSVAPILLVAERSYGASVRLTY
jgi:hypothetical protein